MLVLDVRLEQFHDPIGQLARLDDATVLFTYDANYLSMRDASPLSLSLPLQEAAFPEHISRAWFANLLPENDYQLQQVMDREALSRTDTVGLLYFVGTDCPGAVSCLPQGADAFKVPGSLATDYDFKDEAWVVDTVARLANQEPLIYEDRDPSPVAGVQPKISLVYTPDGHFALPKPGLGVPTTHILKVPKVEDQGDVLLEARAAQFAQASGLDAVLSEPRSFGQYHGLLIPRYDREMSETGEITRVHQEDFAQALGLANTLKYERAGSSGRAFNLDTILSVLDQCASPALARQAFLDSVFFNVVIGNNDNHAKNYSLLYDANKIPNLAPFYDLMPTRLSNKYTDKLAFNIGAATTSQDLTQLDLASLFTSFGFTPAATERYIGSRLRGLLATLELLSTSLLKTDTSHSKMFDDRIGTEIGRLNDLLQLGLDIRVRDDPDASIGGWA